MVFASILKTVKKRLLFCACILVLGQIYNSHNLTEIELITALKEVI